MSAPDWFVQGLQGSLAQGLDQVLRLEEGKIQFVRCLRQALVNPVPHAPDRIQLLHDDIKTLEQTLRLRLGILPLDRSQAWFRHSPATEKGPIPSAMLEAPIFMRFDEARAQAVRLALPELWRQKLIGNEAYDPGPSIWGRLLQLGKKLRQLQQLPAPFADISIDELPEALPDDLASPALIQFCEKLKHRFLLCERDLEACYQQLWTRSEAFLHAMQLQHLSKGAAKGWQKPKAPPPSPIEAALRFMSFSRLPNVDELRHRYRAMAKNHHPDSGGNPETFQTLSSHYQALLKQLQKVS